MDWRVLRAASLAACVAVLLPSGLKAETRPVSASQIHITGGNYFSNEQIAQQLSVSLRNHQALSPKSPVEDVRGFFEKHILQNYRHEGFLDVAVQIDIDYVAGEYRIAVDEGVQYRVGDIHVTGLPKGEAEVFRSALAEPFVPLSTKLDGFDWRHGKWEPVFLDEDGQPVKTTPSTWTKGQPVRALNPEFPAGGDEIGNAFFQIGRLGAEAKVETEREQEHRLSFHLKFSKLASLMLGKHLQITGCRRNTPDDLLKYLEIDPDEVLTQKRLREINLRLWLSGRFVEIHGQFARAPAYGEPPMVQLELEEYENAPPILEPLPEAEQAMLRFHQWLSRLGESKETLRIANPSAKVASTFLVSPQHGLLLSIADHHILAAPGKIVYCAASRQERLTIPLPGRTFAFGLSLDFPAEPQDGNRQRLFDWDLRFDTSPAGPTTPAVTFRVRANPCACLSLLHASETQYSIDGGVLTVASPRSKWEIDTETGRLLKRVIIDENGMTNRIITTTSESFEVICRDTTESWGSYTECFGPSQPVSSTVRFVLAAPKIRRFMHEAVAEGTEYPMDSAQLSVILKLLDKAALPLADEFVQQWWHDQPSDLPKFTAYGDRELLGEFPQNTAAQGTFAVTVAALGLFPEGTWPYRCIGTIGFGRARCSSLYRLHAAPLFRNPSKSPICDMILALWFERASQGTAKQLAWRGLENLNQKAFLQDRALLLDEGHVFGRLMLHVTETLQDLTDQEAEALITSSFCRGEPGLVAAVQCLRLQRDRPAWEVLPDAVELGWETSWREAVKTQLSEVIKRNTPQPERGERLWQAGQEAAKKSETGEPNVAEADSQAPFSQPAQTASRPTRGPARYGQLPSAVPKTIGNFELQGPFSK